MKNLLYLALIFFSIFVVTANADMWGVGGGAEGVFSPPASGSGTGDVVGPSSATDEQLVLFDLATGKLIKASTSTGYGYVTSGVFSVKTGTSAQYLRADGTVSTLDSLACTENTNLYFTNARAIAALLTGYTSGAGTISSSDSVLGAIQKLNGNVALKLDIAAVSFGGNAATATSLAANPTDCSADTYATTIAASGNLTCASITNAATTATSANTASAIVARDGSGNFSATTVTAALLGNASTATAFASNPTDCGVGEFATAIAANGNLTCSAPTGGGMAMGQPVSGGTSKSIPYVNASGNLAQDNIYLKWDPDNFIFTTYEINANRISAPTYVRTAQIQAAGGNPMFNFGTAYIGIAKSITSDDGNQSIGYYPAGGQAYPMVGVFSQSLALGYDQGETASIPAAGTIQTKTQSIILKPASTKGVAINTSGSKATCDSSHRGEIFYEAGGTSVADILYVCVKDAADAYSWKTVTIL